MKTILLISLLGLTAYGQERESMELSGLYSDDNYVICDLPARSITPFIEEGFFSTESLTTEGFIHCARPRQLEYVMRKYFSEDSYVLFVSHKDNLGVDLIYEGKDPNNLYPHLYRSFYKEDLIAHFTIQRNEAGQFEIPQQLKIKTQK